MKRTSRKLVIGACRKAERMGTGSDAAGLQSTALPIPKEEAIREGKRNKRLISLGGAMRRQGANEEDILEALRAVNRSQCDPPLDDDEVQTIASSAGKYPPSGGSGESQASKLLSLCAELELFHTPEEQAYATLPVDDHHETRSLHERAFKRWMSARYYAKFNSAPNAQAVNDALSVLEGRSLFNGREV